MTYSMLASIVKYPYSSLLARGKNKFGFFASEQDDFVKVASELGMIARNDADGDGVSYARHPLVYLVEAADDICYEVMDIEDAHKLGWVPTQQVIDLLLGFFPAERVEHMQNVMSRVDDPNEKIVYLRSVVIGELVRQCSEAFVANEDAILEGRFEGSLLDHITPTAREGYRRCNELSWNKIYCASDVVDIDLAGTSIITFLLEKLVEAVRNPQFNYSRLLLSKVPQQYEINAPSLYGKIQAVIDHVSGMTDVYALDLYRKLNGMSLKINN